MCMCVCGFSLFNAARRHSILLNAGRYSDTRYLLASTRACGTRSGQISATIFTHTHTPSLSHSHKCTYHTYDDMFSFGLKTVRVNKYVYIEVEIVCWWCYLKPRFKPHSGPPLCVRWIRDTHMGFPSYLCRVCCDTALHIHTHLDTWIGLLGTFILNYLPKFENWNNTKRVEFKE